MSDVKDAMREYEALKREMRDKENRIEELKEIILPALPEDKEVQMEYGHFVVRNRLNWTFSPATKELKKQLKKQEDDEKAKGIATSTASSVLYYISSEEKEDAE